MSWFHAQLSCGSFCFSVIPQCAVLRQGLTKQHWLAWNSRRSTCLCLLSAEIKGVRCHNGLLTGFFFFLNRSHFILCAWVLFCLHVWLCTTYKPGFLQRPEEGVIFPEMEGTDDCEVRCRSRELTQVLWKSATELIPTEVTTEPSPKTLTRVLNSFAVPGWPLSHFFSILFTLTSSYLSVAFWDSSLFSNKSLATCLLLRNVHSGSLPSFK